MRALRDYGLVTLVYWAFTLSDGALRMLVLLHFHHLGYSPLQLAVLFLLYEFFGVVTNLGGGWLAARLGVNVTLWGGTALQIMALLMLAGLDPSWTAALSVGWVMAAQALSGIAKDLTKMSAKSALKTLVPPEREGTLFRWVALLTGSKNALKGVGFFVGGGLLAWLGFAPALVAMAAVLALMLLGAVILLPRELGKAKRTAGWASLLAKSPSINALSAARFFLFGARDIWFVVGVPVFLASGLGWGFTQVGSFLALWVIGYGVVQASAPAVLARVSGGRLPGGGAVVVLGVLLAAVTALVPLGLQAGLPATTVVLGGLGLFGVVFAITSSLHSYLILAYADADSVATDVGFYYMANAGGRLVGTLLSGLLFQLGGLAGCLWGSVAFAVAATAISLRLPRAAGPALAGRAAAGGE